MLTSKNILFQLNTQKDSQPTVHKVIDAEMDYVSYDQRILVIIRFLLECRRCHVAADIASSCNQVTKDGSTFRRKDNSILRTTQMH
jgi:hypothetical protein